MSASTPPPPGQAEACRTGLPSAAAINSRHPFRPSRYHRPAAVAEAVELLDRHGPEARVIAGGTDLLLEAAPGVAVLVDANGLGLEGVRAGDGAVEIGATTRFAEIAASPLLQAAPYRALAQAAAAMGTPQIRNQATIGGNVCSAVPCGDSLPALLVLDAQLTVTGPSGERSVAVADFFRGARTNALGRGELLTGIRLPAHPGGTASAFVKKGRVAVGDLAVVNVASRLGLDGEGRCVDPRVAVGAVAATPLRLRGSEAALDGQPLRDEVLRRAAERAVDGIRPIDDIRASADYRRALVRVLVPGTVGDAAAAAGREQASSVPRPARGGP